MKNFNIKRFKCLLRWTYEHDKHEFVRSQLMGLLGFTLCLIFFQIGTPASQGYRMGIIAYVIGITVGIICTGSNMYYSMKTRDDWRALTLLPASNLEKFLARYASALLMTVAIFAIILMADVIQYVFWMIVRPSTETFIISRFLNGSLGMAFSLFTQTEWMSFGCLVWMLHSFYLLGYNFFRNTKYSWVLTTLALIILTAGIVSLLTWLFPHTGNTIEISSDDWVAPTLALMVTVFNYWLAYRLFCRRQLMGIFINT